jgi:hypothetical protein
MMTNTSFRRLWTLGIVGAAFCVVSAQQATAQESATFLETQRQLDDKLRVIRLEQQPVETTVDWMWGGWIEQFTFHFDDGIQSSRVYYRNGLVTWTRLSIDENAHEIFARMRLQYNQFHAGDEFDRRTDWEGPNLERGWYRIDIGKAFDLTDPGDPYQLEIKLGRQEIIWGTGYVLDEPLDAVLLDGKIHDWRVRGLFGRLAGSPPNIDTSGPVDGDSNRRFYAIEVAYTGWQDHYPFAYAIWNDDFTDERPKDPFQNYSYDTQYFGLGSRGSFTRDLSYWTEAAFEGGRSYGDRDVFSRDAVQAWAMNAGLEYNFSDTPTRPRVSAEYMFASGDGHRLESPTNARGGNSQGMDTGFVGFGYRDTGISAGHVLSNLHIGRVGASFLPFESHEWFRNFELGTNWFYYHKNHESGAISDSTATLDGGFVGWEMDYYMNWRFASDLSWTVRWGAYFPGDAYEDRGTRHFVFTGVTWSF